MTTAEILERAADEIDKRGWVQGVFTDGAGVCALGAVKAVMGKDIIDACHDDDYYDVSTLLGNIVDPDLKYGDAASWNDHPQNTKENVCRTLREVAAKLTEQESLPAVVEEDPAWETRQYEPATSD